MPRPAWLRFFQRTFPSANMVLVAGERPLLVDTGFGSDVAETEQLLRGAGTPPERLALLVNTHYHGDHAGGNAALQARHALPVATSAWDAAIVNTRDREACNAEWLDQPVEPYTVDQALRDGDELDAGGVSLRVVLTPGHTLGHLCLYAPDDGALICGDAVHGDDVAWLTPYREGIGALQRALESLDRLAALNPRWACSGHGAPMEDPLAAIDAARRRYDRWLDDPTKLAWHACKRIFSYKLMLTDGMDESEVAPYLLRQGWFQDYARHSFGLEPADFVRPLLDELVRSGACAWRDVRLVAAAPYTYNPAWRPDVTRPRDWPPVHAEQTRVKGAEHASHIKRSLNMDAPEPQVVAVWELATQAAETARKGAIWSLASADLNANLVRLAQGEAIEPHVNDEVDVLGMVVAGAGALVIAEREEPLRPGVAFFIPKGTRRALRATTSELVYLTCHRRRGGLMPTRAPRP